MGTRLDLQSLLEITLGSNNVYFQPPPTVTLEYPCIVYRRTADNVEYADNCPYKRRKRYTVIIIDRNPDSIIPDRVAKLPYSSFSTAYTKNNLNHDVYNIYY